MRRAANPSQRARLEAGHGHPQAGPDAVRRALRPMCQGPQATAGNSPRFQRAPTHPRAEREAASASGGSTPPRTVPCHRRIPASADSTPPLTRPDRRGGGRQSDRLRVNPTPFDSVRLHPGKSGLGTSHGHRHSPRVRAAAELHGLHGRGYPVRSDSIRLNPTAFVTPQRCCFGRPGGPVPPFGGRLRVNPGESDSIRPNPTPFGSDECRWDGSSVHLNLCYRVTESSQAAEIYDRWGETPSSLRCLKARHAQAGGSTESRPTVFGCGSAALGSSVASHRRTFACGTALRNRALASVPGRGYSAPIG